jgi:hypothetical protein
MEIFNIEDIVAIFNSGKADFKNVFLSYKPDTQKCYKLFYNKTNLSNVFIAYKPDSQVHFNNYPEFNYLFDRFTAHNKLNNTGDVVRLWSLILNIRQIMSENIEGDFAELGVWRGNTASVLAYFAAQNNRKVILFDTYEGFNKSDLDGIDSDKKMEFNDTSLDMVKDVIGDYSIVCEFVKGHFPDSASDEHKTKKYSVVSLDCDLYAPMIAGLNYFYPLMPHGALFLLHDYSSLYWNGAKQAIDEFCQENNEYVVLIPDKSGSAFIRKSN